jgi:UDP-glucose 4-epimerase
MNVLVTGGAGYIGHELVRELLSNEQVSKIVIYDNLSARNYNLFLNHNFPQKKISFIKGELLDSRKLKKVITDIDVVYHLAAKVSNPQAATEAHAYEQSNNWGTAELVYAVEESNVSKFIYVSSTSVYGSTQQLVDADYFPNPISFYGSSKLRGEAHVKRLFNKIQTYIIRSANVFGYSDGMRFDTVINRFMFDANFNGRIQIQGNGDQVRSFVHIEKITNVLHNLLKISDFPSGIYNLIGVNLTVNQVAEVVHSLYPKMEMIYLNQHIKMPSLKIEPDADLNKIITLPHQSIEEDLKHFKSKFSFSSFD